MGPCSSLGTNVAKHAGEAGWTATRQSTSAETQEDCEGVGQAGARHSDTSATVPQGRKTGCQVSVESCESGDRSKSCQQYMTRVESSRSLANSRRPENTGD